MNQVRPGQKLPLSYVVAAGTAGLVIKASIQTLAGVQLAAVTLTEIHTGVHSDTSYDMPTGTEALRVVYSPYLTGGTTPDTGNPVVGELFQVITPIIASGLIAVLGAEDQPVQNPITVVQTSDQNLVLSFQHPLATPADTAAATGVFLRVQKEDGTTLAKSLGSGITAVAGAVGQYLVQLVSADFVLLKPGANDVQVEVDLPDGHHVMQLRSVLEVEISVVA
jgi:hypothetical protein